MSEEIFESRNIPKLNLPPASRNTSRSPTRLAASPIRFHQPYIPVDYDALLNDQALSISQRDLLCRVLEVSKKAREWCDTMEDWNWSGSFDNPVFDKSTINRYEAFLDDVHDQLERMEVDELKERILSIHQANSRPSSAASSVSISRLNFLDDFSFHVTKVLLALLPNLSKLNRYERIWSIRLSVFALVPLFLASLDLSKSSMRLLWRRLDNNVEDGEDALNAEQSVLKLSKEKTGATIVATGQILDQMLDLLEGQNDTLPDSWIDLFEAVESDITSWAVAAEQKILLLRHNLVSASVKESELGALASLAQDVAETQPKEVTRDELLDRPSAVQQKIGLESSLILEDTPNSFVKDHISDISIKPNIVLDQAETISSTAPDGRASSQLFKHTVTHPASNDGERQLHNTQPLIVRPVAESTLQASTTVNSPKTLELNESSLPKDFASRVGVPQAVDNIEEAAEQETDDVVYSIEADNTFNKDLSSDHDESLQDKIALPVTAGNLIKPGVEPLVIPSRHQLSNSMAGNLKPVVQPSITEPDVFPTVDHGSFESAPKFALDGKTSPPGETSTRSSATSMQESVKRIPAVDVISSRSSAPFSTMRSQAPEFDEEDDDDDDDEHEYEPISPITNATGSRSQTPEIALPSDPSSPLGSDNNDNSSSADNPRAPLVSAIVHSADSNISSVVPDVEEDDDLPEYDQTVIHHHIATPQKISQEDLFGGTPSVVEEDSDLSDFETPSRKATNYSNPPLNAMVQKNRQTNPLLNIIADDDDSNLQEPEDLPLPSIETSESHDIPFPSIEEGDLVAPPGPLLGKKSPRRAIRSPVSPRLALQDQLSSILSSLPTPIRLKSGPAPNAPDIKSRPAATASTSSRAPIQTRSRTSSIQSVQSNPGRYSRSSTPALTLAPASAAEENSNARRNSKDPDVRLYHLIQTGRDKPIKLFIRRVGENGERVMVRVGGGWADLAEYLRGYAEHHGTRAVSGSEKVEIQPIAPGTTSTKTRGNTSRRPSVYSNRSRSGTPAPMSDGFRSPTPDLMTPPQSNPRAASVPFSPSREDSNLVVPTSLAGPYASTTATAGPLSDEKQEWIDGIMAQAKKTLGTDVELGDLGKKGGTRRIYFKGPPRSGTPIDSSPISGEKNNGRSSRAASRTGTRSGNAAN